MSSLQEDEGVFIIGQWGVAAVFKVPEGEIGVFFQ